MTSSNPARSHPLEERRARRAKRRYSLINNLNVFLKRLRIMWAYRRDRSARWVLYSTMPLTSKLRLKLCLFSDPITFVKHLFTQSHPRVHHGMVLALDTPTIPYHPVDHWGQRLERSFEVIAQEWERAHQQTVIHPNHDRLVEMGRWTLIPLYKGGTLHRECAVHFPKTMKIIEQMPHCAIGLDGIGQVVFSQLEPNTHILTHSGSTNLRLRYHLPITVDPNAKITVHGESRYWERGRCLIFDDGLAHCVEHKGTETRVILLVDLWRPELSECQVNLLCKLLSV